MPKKNKPEALSGNKRTNEEESPETPKRKRRRPSELPWSPKSERRMSGNHSINFLAQVRCNNQVEKDGKAIDTSVVFLDLTLDENQKKLLEEEILKTPHHVPFGEATEHSETGTPTKGVTATPRRRSLYSNGTNGVAAFFSTSTPEQKSFPRVTQLSPETEQAFLSSDIVNDIKPNTKDGCIEMLITQKLINEAANQVRSPSQNTVMGGSATQYAQETGKFPAYLKWEWAHYIPHHFLGNKAQREEYMACKTSHSNTIELLVELRLPQLLEKYSKGFWLKIEPEFVRCSQSTHIATMTRFTVSTFDGDPIFRFKYDGQEDIQPHFNQHRYMGHLFQVHCMDNHASNTISSPPRISRKKGEGILFMDRKLPSSSATLFNKNTGRSRLDLSSMGSSMDLSSDNTPSTANASSVKIS